MQLNETPSAFANVTRRRDADLCRPIEILLQVHENQRWFCGQLRTLADDIWQLGHEKLAASLLDYAIAGPANALNDQTEPLARALLQRCASNAASREVVSEMVRRHRGVASLAAPTIDGLHRLARGGLPPAPTLFVLSALGLVETLQRNLDWEETVLLPLASSSLTRAD